MRKALIIILIALASLLMILIAVVSIALWFVFTPEKLTPLIRKEAARYLTCPVTIDRVELTFFSTFPHFGIKVNQVGLINPVPGAPNDTLFRADELTGIIDLETWYYNRDIRIEEVILRQGALHLFTDSLGKVNYDILAPLPENGTDTSNVAAGLENIRFEKVDFSYADLSSATSLLVQNLTGSLTGTYRSGTLNSRIEMDQGVITLESGMEKYLDQVSTKLTLLSDITIDPVKMEIRELAGTLNGFPLELAGSFDINPVSEDLFFDLKFKLASSPVDKLIPMVPASYQGYFEGIKVRGMLAAEGTMKGTYNDSVMPFFDIRLTMRNGKASYEGFPLPMDSIFGRVNIRTDGLSDALSSVTISRLHAKSGDSRFNLEGTITRLFSDPRFDLKGGADLLLSEFNPLIPDSLKTTISGRARGKMAGVFTMTQLENTQTDRMSLSGEIGLSGFRASYDSLSLKTDSSLVRFTLPNPRPTHYKTGFMHLDIKALNLSANKANSFETQLSGAHLTAEISDFLNNPAIQQPGAFASLRETPADASVATKSVIIPDLICSFAVDALSGGMDTLSLATKNVSGKVVVSPREGHPDQPVIRLNGKTGKLLACQGRDSLSLGNFHLETDIVNRKEEKEVLLQWLPAGTLAMEQGKIVMTGLTPMEIPAIRADFSPERLDIKESRLKIGHSDFALSGTLKNMLSWYRKDSILRADLNFVSNHTDVPELMRMTSGLGYSEEELDTLESTGDSGPYMVPKGLDITLHTLVKKATFGSDTATDIQGDLRVYDGILLLDEMKLTTPAARMMITSMYQTPRKNHLFLGLDFHLLDIEISHLLNMLPDIDTIMPMLRSFSGKGEFHIAVETYLDSLYRLKMSTLRGAASIKGQDLVLMDGETFSEIAKTLKFSKKTENRVDSLSTEFTIFRNEIDIFPFLIVMDKYKAIIAGRHNLDMSFDYHISVVDSPLPFRLGVNVNGTMDDLSYKLAPCKFSAMYRPSARKAVESKQLEIRQMIRDALLRLMNWE